MSRSYPWEKHNKVHGVEMEETVENHNSNVGIPMKKTNNVKKMYKCNQCKYTSFYAGNLKTHLKKHSGEKTNKCNQCDFASYLASNLRNHLRTHSGEKPNNATNVTMPLPRQAN